MASHSIPARLAFDPESELTGCLVGGDFEDALILEGDDATLGRDQS
jgi:hypothetical protein